MESGRLRDHSLSLSALRRDKWKHILPVICKSRLTSPKSAASSSQALLFSFERYVLHDLETQRYLRRNQRIHWTHFAFNFNSMTDASSLSLFRFRKKDVIRMVEAVAWPSSQVATARNRYSCSRILVTCVLLRRLCSPARWRDMELLFGRHAAQLSEIFWEGLEQFLNVRKHLITGDICKDFIEANAPFYAQAVRDKRNSLDKCVAFIDGTVIGIARPVQADVQAIAYNGHKRNHALKYQAVTTPDGLILHAAGPLEGRRHDWTCICAAV